MIPLDLHSERFAPTGNLAGEGFRRLLGRPALGLLQTVIREALQNSVDAALHDRNVEIFLRFRTLEGEALDRLRNLLFQALPPEAKEASGEQDDTPSLHDILGIGRVSVLEIADFNTRGLGGPTRADVATGTEQMDFVNFLRNVGAARDMHHGGGTYGYGKTSLYALSRVSTIIADSQAIAYGEPVRRLMGCHLGPAFEAPVDDKPRRFTGRHWWGRSDSEGGVEPVEGVEAIELSDALGLPQRDERRTGTTVAILAPHVDGGVDLRAELVEAVLWNFWPRMCTSTPEGRKIEVSLEFEGEKVIIPAPEDYPPLDLYAEALRNVRGEGAGEVTTIRSPSLRSDLGRLSIVRGMYARRNPIAQREESPMRAHARAIALMRPVELVVRYLPGEPFADQRFEWAGAFVCSKEDEIESAFAVSEPPAHDDWIPDMLPKGRSKTAVNVAMRELKLAAAGFAQPTAALGAAHDKGPSVAKTAAKLGTLLTGASGKGPGRPVSPGGGVSRKRIQISSPRFVRLELIDGRRVARFEADLTNDGSQPSIVLRAMPHLVVDGSAASTDDLPDDISVELLRMSLGERETAADTIELGTLTGIVSCLVSVPIDAAVGIRFSFDEASTE